MKNTRGILENAGKGLQAIPADSWPLHAVMGLQVNSFFFSCCMRSTFACQFKFDRQMSSGANDQAKVLQYAAFHDHVWGHVLT